VKEKKHDEARRLQALMSPIARMVTSGFGVPGLKAALEIAGYKGGDPRAPLAPASPEAKETIRAELARVAQVV
jgi:4-hydroxy-2-oxoglutarate aldolase